MALDVTSEFIVEINFSTSKSPRLRLLWMELAGCRRYYNYKLTDGPGANRVDFSSPVPKVDS